MDNEVESLYKVTIKIEKPISNRSDTDIFVLIYNYVKRTSTLGNIWEDRS